MKKLFGDVKMTWVKVMVLAVATAAYTGFVNLLPAFKDTSFQDIAVYPEFWIIFAVFIVVNCSKWYEASLKCFVFFLISQPLIYLIEVPFSGWHVFSYYPYWLMITFLTLPGAAVAYLLKKKNFLSVAVLTVATVFLSYRSVEYFKIAFGDFPHHILSSVYCVLLAVVLALVLFDRKKYAVTALAAFAVSLAVFAAFALAKDRTQTVFLGDGNWSYTADGDGEISIEFSQNEAKISPKKKGTVHITFTDENSNSVEYYATVSGSDMYLDKFEE